MSIVERNQDQIRGVIACFDRVIIQGILPYLCYADGMTSWLRRHEVRIFDYARYTEPLRDQIRENAERLANEHGVQIEFVSSSKVRKESLVKEVLDRRGDHPGLVHILSAMESCPSYRPWHDKNTHKTFLKFRTGSCLHYYFYFVDPELGLCYIRVPTWCPFRLQIYFNGHNVLARRLDQAGIAYRLIDNAFVDVEDFEAAQRLADDLDIDKLHRILDDYAALCCPVIETLELRYHWSLMQIEYATDIVFRRQRDLAPLYESIVRTAVHAVKAANVATFLGRKLVGQYRDELGNNFDTRIMGTRIKHHMGPASIKMYDKFGLVCAHRDHGQRRLLLQAPPKSGTPGRDRVLQARSGSQDHLQPQRSSRAPRGRQPQVHRLHLRAAGPHRWRQEAPKGRRAGGQQRTPLQGLQLLQGW